MTKKKFGLVANLKDLRMYFKTAKPNPLERVMAVNLLLSGYSFFPQKKVELPEGWVVDNRKFFVVDFKLTDDLEDIIIEVDGKIHEEKEVKEKDRNRDNVLVALGYRVFHFSWDEVMTWGMDGNYDILNLLEYFKDNFGVGD